MAASLLAEMNLPFPPMPLDDTTRFDLPSTEQLLLQGGDARIALGADGVSNKYGCSPLPDSALLAFGSSTASTISKAGFDAANKLRNTLLRSAKTEPHHVTYARELDRVRHELMHLCGIHDFPDVDVVFAASGTDLHLISAQLVGGEVSTPALVIMVDAEETGRGVPAAVAGRHFSTQSALGASVLEGSSIAGGTEIEVATVSVRHIDGTPRNADEIDADVASMANAAAARNQRVLLILADVTKTGMVAPTVGCATGLRQRLPDIVEIMVDACQFRIAPATLRAYLEHDFMVAVTGSKFLTGPTFAGALFIPPAPDQRLRKQSLPRALSAYSSRAEWPLSWVPANTLDNVANFGLLLRWEAALEELRAFHAVPETEVTNFLQTFAQAIQHHLENNPIFRPLPVPQIDRRALTDAKSWDQLPTIFPFLLCRPAALGGKPLNREQTMEVYRSLQVDLTAQSDFAGSIDLSTSSLALQCQLGQPVACGERDGVPVSALRICASARLVVEAVQNGKHAAAVIERALDALEKTALLVTRLA